MNRYRVVIHWGERPIDRIEHTVGGILVCEEHSAQSLKKRLLKHKGDFVEFTTEDGGLVRVRKSLIDCIQIYRQ